MVSLSPDCLVVLIVIYSGRKAMIPARGRKFFILLNTRYSVFMSYHSSLLTLQPSKPEIERQLDKIFLDPLFSESKILQSFLSFVVNETLENRSNRLKEYTIGVNVLKKPRDFKPHENAIVRIHAGRLRRALDHYYCENGAMDDIRICIPKGTYVPVISERKDNNVKPIVDNNNRQTMERIIAKDTNTFAVMPFLYLTNQPAVHSFSDGLCLRLTKELMHVENTSVICYQAVKSAARKFSDFKKMLAELRSDYLITGSIQFVKGLLRVNVQVIRNSSCMQIWSKSYERKLKKSNILQLEDEVSQLVNTDILELPEFKPVGIIPPLRLAAI